METNEKSREQDGAADEQAQKKLTTSVGTPLDAPREAQSQKAVRPPREVVRGLVAGSDLRGEAGPLRVAPPS